MFQQRLQNYNTPKRERETIRLNEVMLVPHPK